MERVADPDPVVLVGSLFLMRLDPDPVFKLWCDPEPVSKASRYTIHLKSTFLAVFIVHHTVLNFQLY